MESVLDARLRWLRALVVGSEMCIRDRTLPAPYGFPSANFTSSV